MGRRPRSSVYGGGRWNLGTLLAGAGGPAFTATIWNASDQTGSVFTLSNGNRTATSTVASIGGIRGSGSGVSTGKYYFEATMTVWNSSTGVGLSTPSAVLSASATGNVHARGGAGGSLIRNGSSAGPNLGTRANGDIIGIAMDLGGKLIWFRVAPAGNWNGNVSFDPASGTGGIDTTAVGSPLLPVFVTNTNAMICAANFGNAAFSGTVPSGFTAGWPA